MDLNLAKTFLEVIRSGSFVTAADRLHVTQTTVTARIKSLEEELKCQLFIRNRSGATLTPDGEKFTSYAISLVQTWEKAKLDLPLPHGRDTHLTIAAEMALWNPLLYNWVNALRRELPNVVLRVETDMAGNLVEKLSRGILDIAIIHRVEYIPGFQIEQLLEEKLILVAAKEQDAPYIFIDWGEEFRKQHDTALPELSSTELTFDFGPLALQYILSKGGSGYFRTRVVASYLEQGVLTRVKHAPEFSYPIYLAYSKQRLNSSLEEAIEIVRRSAVTDPDWGPLDSQQDSGAQDEDRTSPHIRREEP